jgi:GAF domain-containing protein
MADNYPNREALTSSTFVELVDTIVSDFDVIDLLTVLSSRCVELLGVAAAGILLADEAGNLRVMAASTDQIGLLELFQIQNDEGPCLDCYATGQQVAVSNLAAGSRWPKFTDESLAAGYQSVCAIPLRLKHRVLGCLNLFIAEPVALVARDVALAQALADVASISIIQDEATRQATIREGQLQHALTSRIAIEQAKGALSQSSGYDMAQCFDLLRDYARRNNRRLTDVASDISSRRLDPSVVTQRVE